MRLKNIVSELIKSQGQLCGLLASVPIIMSFFALIQLYGANIPFWDDFDSVFHFISRFHQSSTVERFWLLIEQHNEHRMVLNRLLVLASLIFKGGVELKLLMYCAAVGLVALFLALVAAIKIEDPLVSFVVILSSALLLFQPLYADGMIWVTTAIQSFWVSGCAAITFLLIQKRKHSYFVCALLLAMFSLFIQGNGILILFIGACQIFLAREYRRLVSWGLGSVIALVLFLFEFSVPKSDISIWYNLFSAPLKTIHFGCAFLGHTFGLGNLRPATIYGVIIFAMWLFALSGGAIKRAPALFSLSLFALLSAALVCMTRFDAHGHVWCLGPGRYTLVSNIAALSAIALVGHVRYPIPYVRLITGGALGFLLYFYPISYLVGTEKLVAHSEGLARNTVTWVEGGEPAFTYPDGPRALGIMAEAVRAGDFNPHDAIVGTIRHDLSQRITPHKEMRGHIDAMTVSKDGRFVSFRGWGCFSLSCAEFPVVLRLQSRNERPLFIVTHRMRKPEIANALGFREFYDSGFAAVIPSSLLKSGTRYTVRIVIPTTDALLADSQERYLRIE